MVKSKLVGKVIVGTDGRDRLRFHVIKERDLEKAHCVIGLWVSVDLVDADAVATALDFEVWSLRKPAEVRRELARMERALRKEATK